MFRITVCILASLVSVAAEAKTKTCDVNGYSIDKDPNGLNVRSGPGGGHAVITSLRRTETGWPHLHITGASGNWLRIDTAIEGMDPDGMHCFAASAGFTTASLRPLPRDMKPAPSRSTPAPIRPARQQAVFPGKKTFAS